MVNRIILAIVPDLMVGVRIGEAAKQVGASVETVDSGNQAVESLGSHLPGLIVVDLGIAGLDIGAIAEAARGRGIPVVAFYPHVDVELRRSARRAGIEHVYARSRFLRETAGILRERLEG